MRKVYPLTLLSCLLAIFLITPVLASSQAPSVATDIAQKMLVDGNERFVSEKYNSKHNGHIKRTELLEGQHPFAVIVSCSDSRVPPEILFDQGLGDLFVVRTAGNVLDAIELGSIEYAVEHLGTKLIVVLGHEKCGAVKATIDGGHIPPNIAAIAAKIQPAVASARTSNPTDIYEAAATANIMNMVTVLNNDPVITHINGVKIVGAKYHLDSGKADFF